MSDVDVALIVSACVNVVLLSLLGCAWSGHWKDRHLRRQRKRVFDLPIWDEENAS